MSESAQPTHAIYRHRDDESILLAVRPNGESYEALRAYGEPMALDAGSLHENYTPVEENDDE